MIVTWILFVCSIIVLPTMALLALRWTLQNGEFNDLKKISLSIFDETEPIGQMTDFFPDHDKTKATSKTPETKTSTQS